METPTEHWTETLTGLGATGVEIMLGYTTDLPMQAHPLIPLLQVTADDSTPQQTYQDVDLVLTADSTLWAERILQRLVDVAEGTYTPKLYALGNTDFQVTRGMLGISL
jgi:hypothetical protein